MREEGDNFRRLQSKINCSIRISFFFVSLCFLLTVSFVHAFSLRLRARRLPRISFDQTTQSVAPLNSAVSFVFLYALAFVRRTVKNKKIKTKKNVVEKPESGSMALTIRV